MKFAYADPPYLGLAERFYGDKHPEAAAYEAFCFWVFDLLGARPEDTMADIFPGTGAVTEAWNKYRALLVDERKTLFDETMEAPHDL